MAKKKIITRASEQFLEAYLNNPSPTGFESGGQKLWLDYITPYIDEHIVDTYGTVVGVINPEAKRHSQAYSGMMKRMPSRRALSTTQTERPDIPWEAD